MSTVECQFCGARLILPEGDLPPEVRCKRCGRRVNISQRPNTARSRTSRDQRSDQVRPERLGNVPPPPFASLPQEAPKVAAYPTQKPPPVPFRNSPRPSSWKLPGLASAAVIGLVITIIAAQQFMSGKGSSSPARTNPPAVTQVAANNSPPSSSRSDVPQGNGTGGQVNAGRPDSETAPPASGGANSQQQAAKSPERTAAPALPPTQPDSMHGIKGLAKKIEAEPHFNTIVYANSEIALRKLEQARSQLKRENQTEWFTSKFQPPTGGELGEALHWVIWAKFISNLSWLNETKPAFRVNFTHAPKDTRIRIQLLGLNDSSKLLLTSPQATTREWITLNADAQQERVWFHPKDNEHWNEDTWVIGLQPLWDINQLASIANAEHINLAVDIEYGDGTADDRHVMSAKIVPVQNVELSYPLGLGFSGLINADHPWIAQILNEVNQCQMAKRPEMIDAPEAEANFFSVFLLWREMRARGLRYQSLVGTPDKDPVQAVRAIEETLAVKNANCIDGSILFCSFFERMGLDCFLMMPKGHAYVMFDDTEDRWSLETTAMSADRDCEDGYRNWVLDKFPRVKKLVTTLKDQDAKDFRSYLAALETGHETTQIECELVMKGDQESQLPPVKSLMEVMGGDENAESDKEKAFTLIRFRYMSLYNLKTARDAGIEPVPIPKKFKTELPPQPARTR